MPDQATTEPTTAPETTQGDPADLGDKGKQALQAERQARSTAEKQVKLLEAQVQAISEAQTKQNNALAEAFGLKPEDTTDVGRLASQVTSLQEQFAATQRANAVLTVANQHGITDKDDLELLQSAKDEDAMRRIAARISTAGAGPSTPKPDLTQGGNGQPAGKTAAEAFGDFITQARGR
jgi:hypothetical protein